MKINLDDLRACINCGCVFDMTEAKRTKPKHDYENPDWICPACKKRMHFFGE